jgi:hypothetical protein
MDHKSILDAITQVGFPVVLTIGLIFWMGRYALPKVTEMFNGLIDDFREEMETERRFHADNIRLLIDTNRAEHQEIKDVIRNGRNDNHLGAH